MPLKAEKYLPMRIYIIFCYCSITFLFLYSNDIYAEWSGVSGFDILEVFFLAIVTFVAGPIALVILIIYFLFYVLPRAYESYITESTEYMGYLITPQPYRLIESKSWTLSARYCDKKGANVDKLTTPKESDLTNYKEAKLESIRLAKMEIDNIFSSEKLER